MAGGRAVTAVALALAAPAILAAVAIAVMVMAAIVALLVDRRDAARRIAPRDRAPRRAGGAVTELRLLRACLVLAILSLAAAIALVLGGTP